MQLNKQLDNPESEKYIEQEIVKSEQEEETEVASATEKFLKERIAPELLRPHSRIIILFLYLIVLSIAVYGCTQNSSSFTRREFIKESAYLYDFYELDDDFFESGSWTSFFIDNADIDYASEEV